MVDGVTLVESTAICYSPSAKVCWHCLPAGAFPTSSSHAEHKPFGSLTVLQVTLLPTPAVLWQGFLFPELGPGGDGGGGEGGEGGEGAGGEGGDGADISQMPL